MVETLDLIAEYGTVTAAAKVIDVPRGTLETRYLRARNAVSKGDIIGPPWIVAKPDPVVVKSLPAPNLIASIKEIFAGYDGFAPSIPQPSTTDDKLLTVYPLPDLHLGMLAWGAETGADYDLTIATKTALAGVDTLVSQSQPSAHAVLLGLGDYFHADDSRGVTRRGGHMLDMAARWPQIFAAGVKLATAMVETIARKHEMVEVRFLPGNHDGDSATYLSVALGCFFSRSMRITVREDPAEVWYRRFGSVLLGASHGHAVKPAQMPMMMAMDRAEDWGATRYRSMFSGHIHSETSRTIGGVRVESLEAPAARDKWNTSQGYRAGRSMTAITFHADRGEIGRHRVNIG